MNESHSPAVGDGVRQELPDRREFLARGAGSSASMAVGLAAGYGTFVYFAGRYLYPSTDTDAWMFVTDTASLQPGAALTFISPTGVAVVITRKPGAQESGEVGADDFLALSSICPHLGCRVHWESQNNRFFCPCHLGAFDADGQPTEGPPLTANQALPKYALRIENGLLYISMPVKPIDPTTMRIADHSSQRCRKDLRVRPTATDDTAGGRA